MKTSLLITFCAFILVACGGGSSSSGGPPPPAPLLATVGQYEGTAVVQVTSPGNGAIDFETTIDLSVGGNSQNQQVFLAYREFSGSSNLDSQLRFSIPSGTLRFEWFEGIVCEGEITYVGQFIDSTVTGTMDGSFQCPTGDVVTYNGTFSAQFTGTVKRAAFEYSVAPELAF